MLKHLRLQNIILIEEATLSFNSGFNILTGETGSGKSAIMHGLSLAIGDRSDASIIRNGCDKGIVEAIFEVENHDLLFLLSEGGIDHEPGQELVIRRELSTSGKSRIFINNQSAQLAFLKKIGQYLARIVGQHAAQELYSTDYQRQILDLYGGHIDLANLFQSTFEQENRQRIELEQMIQQEAQRLREIDICLSELEELEEAQVKEGEEEALFSEYTLLVNSEEISDKIQEINQGLTGEKLPVVAALNRQKQQLEALLRLDPSLAETYEAFKSALTEIQEIAFTLRQYQSRLHHDPQRLHSVNERLTLLNKLKRKYGATVDQILEYQQNTKQKLTRLENADEEIESLRAQLKESESETNRLALALTEKRKQAAGLIEKEITRQLRELNMSKAELIVEVVEQKRSSTGGDRVEFFLKPNVGEHRVSLKEGASGGEISRVLLSLQALMAGKQQPASLIFDEVDANIGGETASIIGKKLHEISACHQVICITHFPQVAAIAHCHIQISKEERNGRTLTQVKELDVISREAELTRMAGGPSVAL